MAISFSKKSAPLAIPETSADLRAGIMGMLAKQLKVGAEEINPTTAFVELGFDSINAVRFTGDLEKWLGKELDPTLLYNYTTPDALCGYLSTELELS